MVCNPRLPAHRVHSVYLASDPITGSMDGLLMAASFVQPNISQPSPLGTGPSGKHASQVQDPQARTAAEVAKAVARGQEEDELVERERFEAHTVTSSSECHRRKPKELRAAPAP